MFAIFMVALILFGPKKLPELGRTLGKALSEFRRAKTELKSTFASHLNELERETRMTTTSSPTATTSLSPGSSYPADAYQYDSTSHPSAEGSQASQPDENRASLLAASDSSPDQVQTAAHEAMPALPTVSGTVARTNGVRPLDETVQQPVTHQEQVQEEHPV
jgi:TatA/E family protein of Tat protein translocase